MHRGHEHEGHDQATQAHDRVEPGGYGPLFAFW